jgi:hypothetical protein
VKVPDSYEEFERGMVDKPERLKALYDHFKKSDIQVPDDYGQFEAGMLEGVKKKAHSAPGGLPSAATAPTSSPAVSGQGTNPAQMQAALGIDPADVAQPAPEPTPDVAMAAEAAGLESAQPFAPGSAAAPLAQNLPNLATGEAAVQGGRLPATEEMDYLNGLPAAEDKGVRPDGSEYTPTPYGKELVAIPNDYTGAVPAGAFPLNLSGEGDRTQYFYRDKAKTVDGKEQSYGDALKGKLKNALYSMGQGVVEGTQAAVNTVGMASTAASGLPLAAAPRTELGTEASAAIERNKTKIAPYYNQSFRQHKNWETLGMTAADYAPMVIAQVAQTLAPELRAPAALQKALAFASTTAFDADMYHAAREHAKQVFPNDPAKADLYTLFEGTLTVAGFKVGSKLMTEVGDKLAYKLSPFSLKRAVATGAAERLSQLEAQLGRRATDAEYQQVLHESLRAALPKLAQLPKESFQQAGTFGGVAAAQTIGNQIVAPALGGQADDLGPDGMGFFSKVGEGMLAGAGMGALTGAVGAVLPAGTRPAPAQEPIAGEPELAPTPEAPAELTPSQEVPTAEVAPPTAPDPSVVDVTDQVPEPIQAVAPEEALPITEPVASEQVPESALAEPEGGQGNTVEAGPELGQKERQHPLRYDEQTQAGLRPEERYYTPRARIQNAEEANAFIDEHGLENAYKFVMAGERDTAAGEPIHAAVLDEVRGQTRQRLLDASLAADKVGDTAESTRLLQQSLDVLGKRAIARTETAQALAQVEGDITKNPDKALDDYAASIPATKEKVRKQNRQKAQAADKEATTKRKAKVDAALADADVQDAAERVTEWAVTGQKPAKKGGAKPAESTPADPPTWGSKNKLFTKESAAKAKAALKNLGLSTIIPPELIHFMGYHMEAGARSFADVSKRVVRDLGAKVKPLLKEAYEAAKKELVAKGDSGKGFDGPDAVEAALRASLADDLAGRIVSEVKPKVPGVFDPAQELLETLTKKVRETLPPNKPKPKDAREAIVHALQNKAEYADVFEQSKAEVEARIEKMSATDAEKAKMREQLRAYQADTIGDPFAARQVDATMRQAMKELGLKLEKLVRQHADVREAGRRSLVDALVEGAGLTPAQAAEYAEAVSNRYAVQTQAKAQSLAGRILAPAKAKLPGGKIRSVVDKLTEALDISDATHTGPDSDTVSPAGALLEKMAGIPEVTVEDVKAFRKLAERVRKASQPKGVTIKGKQVQVIDTKAQQAAVADLLRYGAAKMGKVNWWAKTRAMQYAFRLSGLDTQGRNLKANVLHTVAEQGLITPLYNAIKNRSVYGASGGATGYAKGQGQGVAEAAYTIKTGYTGEKQDKFGDNSPLETMGGFWGKWKYVSRAMIAGDQLTSIPTENSRTFEVAVQKGFELAREKAAASGQKLKGRALRDAAWAEANEILYNTKEALADIDYILEQEGLPEITAAQVRAGQHTVGEYNQRAVQRNVRKADLLRQARAAENPDLVKDAQDYARIQTLNGDVPGQIGRVLDAAASIGRDNPVADAVLTNVMPFLKIPANSLLRKLEWGGGPVTLLKAALGRTSLTMAVKEGSKYSRELTPDERGKLALRGALSTVAWAGLYGLIHNGTISISGPASGKNDEDLLQPPMTIKIGDSVYGYKDTNIEYPLVIAAALQAHLRKKTKQGGDPSLAQLASVAALHSAAYMVTTGPINGPADMGNVLIQANQGNYASAGNYFKRFLVTSAKTGTLPAVLIQGMQAARDYTATYKEWASAGQQSTDWQGAAVRERKSNSLADELKVSFFGSIPYFDIGEDKINFAGQPIVINRSGETIWQDEQTKRLAQTLVALGLMPPRQAPTDDKLVLFDPVSGDRVTPLSDAEFKQYAVLRGQAFVEYLTRQPEGEGGKTLLSQIKEAPTRAIAERLRDKALDAATTNALRTIEQQRGGGVTFKLSKQLKQASDAAGFQQAKQQLDEKLATE